jgi:hypothetical protein
MVWITPGTNHRIGTSLMINFSNIDFSKFTDSVKNAPNFDLAKLDLAKLDPRNMANFQMPISLDQVGQAGKTVVHMGIGAAIMTAQTAAAIGREASNQVADRVEGQVRKLADRIA